MIPAKKTRTGFYEASPEKTKAPGCSLAAGLSLKNQLTTKVKTFDHK